MDLSLTDDQLVLRDAVADLLTKHVTAATPRCLSLTSKSLLVNGLHGA